jgi:ABC-type nitrate/sulfonate/bicarbonate transport system substrate-binding protein
MQLVRAGQLVGAVAIMLCCAVAASAQDKPVVTFAYTDDITYEPFVYAIKKGIVKSDKAELKLVPVSIPTALQALGTKQFDLIESSVLGVANAAGRGLDARIVGTGGIVRGGRFVMVNKDSSINAPPDLKGKSMGVPGIATTLVAHLRAIMSKTYGFNVGLENGDLKWVDLPLPTLPIALSRGQVDSAYLIHSPSLMALKSGNFRIVVDIEKSFRQQFGSDPLVSVVVTYDDRIAQKGAALRDAVAQIRESAAYAHSHSDEVDDAVASGTKFSAKDLKTLSIDWYDIRFTLTPDDKKMIETMFDLGAQLGAYQGHVAVDKLLWQ